MGDVLTISELAEELRVHASTARDLLRTGRIVHVHVGKRIRVGRKEFERFLSGEKIDYKCPICRPLAMPE